MRDRASEMVQALDTRGPWTPPVPQVDTSWLTDPPYPQDPVDVFALIQKATAPKVTVPRRTHQGAVYVISPAPPATGPVKIGFTGDDATKRLRSLQTGSPVPLTVLAEFAGTKQLEAKLHRHFAGRRLHGEWFDFTGDDPVALIGAAVHELTG
ncbi:GIY-YIG nuclease family protein [Streptomyces sp. NPDC056883]|uniref:GIY-YIG nuclease family protein n=1 Tax=Streptomyces sp. NPDC056883 TaxID=3345959 RepID=UPI0036C09855